MTPENGAARASGRRAFLARVSAAASALAAAGAARGADAPATDSLPAISLGPHRISRLVAGWNPIGGYSYLGHHMDRHMREYFTVERTVEFLGRCERAGITAHQFSPAENTAE
ncbi:MAG TPA: hypothetical protein DCM87_09010, partial [Planctomycetes bacterium]|nr:hypothetical protein [Planctomycetota bacterium]